MFMYKKLDKEKTEYQMQINFLSIGDLARKTELSSTAIGLLLTGKNSPRPRTLKKICKALNCSQFDILESDKKEETN